MHESTHMMIILSIRINQVFWLDDFDKLLVAKLILIPVHASRITDHGPRDWSKKPFFFYL